MSSRISFLPLWAIVLGASHGACSVSNIDNPANAIEVGPSIAETEDPSLSEESEPRQDACPESRVHNALTNGWCEDVTGAGGTWKARPTFGSESAAACDTFCTFVWTAADSQAQKDTQALLLAFRARNVEYHEPDCSCPSGDCDVPVTADEVKCDGDNGSALCEPYAAGLIYDDHLYAILPASFTAVTSSDLDVQIDPYPTLIARNRIGFRQPGNVSLLALPIFTPDADTSKLRRSWIRRPTNDPPTEPTIKQCTDSISYHAEVQGWCEDVPGTGGAWKAHPTFSFAPVVVQQAFCTFVWKADASQAVQDTATLLAALRQHGAAFVTPDCNCSAGTCPEPAQYESPIMISRPNGIPACPRCSPGLVVANKLHVSLPAEFVTKLPSTLRVFSPAASHDIEAPWTTIKQPGNRSSFAVPLARDTFIADRTRVIVGP